MGIELSFKSETDAFVWGGEVFEVIFCMNYLKAADD